MQLLQRQQWEQFSWERSEQLRENSLGRQEGPLSLQQKQQPGQVTLVLGILETLGLLGQALEILGLQNPPEPAELEEGQW